MNNDAKKRAQHTLSSEKKALESLSVTPAFIAAYTLLQKREGKIIFAGLGKSGFVAQKLAATFTSLGHLSATLHPTDAMHGDIGIVKPGDIIILISYSGKSLEIVKLAQHLKDSFKSTIISITGDLGSRLAKNSDAAISTTVVDEGCPLNLAPMASVLASIAIGDMLASALTIPQEFGETHFAQFHPGGSLGLKTKKIEERMWTGNTIPLVEEQTSLKKVLKEITDKKRGIVGVINAEGKITGVITDGDIRRFFMKEEKIVEITAQDIMSKNPHTITKEKSLLDALSRIEQNKITALFVVDEKMHVIGMIHIHEILEQTLQ